MKSMTTVLTGAFLLLLLTASCAEKPEQQILGKWQLTSLTKNGETISDTNLFTMTWEFLENGRTKIETPTQISVSFSISNSNWSISKDGKLIFTDPGGAGERSLIFHFTGKDTLEITDPDDRTKLQFSRLVDTNNKPSST